MIKNEFDLIQSLELFKECWKLAKNNYSYILILSIFSFIIHKVCSVIPIVGILLSPIVAILLYSGVLRLSKKIYNNENCNYDELFYFFKIISVRSKLINLGLYTAGVIFLLRMSFSLLTFLNPFTFSIEFVVGIVESFVLFFVSILILPEIVFNNLSIKNSFDLSIQTFKKHSAFLPSLLIVSWVLAAISLILLTVPFFLMYLPTVFLLPYIVYKKISAPVINN